MIAEGTSAVVVAEAAVVAEAGDGSPAPIMVGHRHGNPTMALMAGNKPGPTLIFNSSSGLLPALIQLLVQPDLGSQTIAQEFLT